MLLFRCRSPAKSPFYSLSESHVDQQQRHQYSTSNKRRGEDVLFANQIVHLSACLFVQSHFLPILSLIARRPPSDETDASGKSRLPEHFSDSLVPAFTQMAIARVSSRLHLV
jgi:hypothetical protein